MFNISISKTTNKNSRPGFFKLAVIGISVFLIVFILLNISALIGWFGYVRNQFTDADEITETQLLMAKYHSEGLTPMVYANEYDHVTEKDLYSSEVFSSQAATVLGQDILSIPKINVKTPIVIGKSTVSKQILTDLQKGVLLYPGSALPGNGGSTVIIGHSSSNTPWNKYSHVFSLLNRLESGDLIYINSGDASYVYQISAKKTGSVFTIASSDIKGDLILSSCWPVGTDNGRIVVTANLIRS